ncbi:hypothetical protein COCON_G00124860, partial [Conger conger]
EGERGSGVSSSKVVQHQKLISQHHFYFLLSVSSLPFPQVTDRQGGPGQTGRTRTDREDQDREAPAVSHSGAVGRKGHGPLSHTPTLCVGVGEKAPPTGLHQWSRSDKGAWHGSLKRTGSFQSLHLSPSATSVTDLWVHLSPTATSVTDLWVHLSPSATSVTDLWVHLSPSATSVTDLWRHLSPSATSVTDLWVHLSPTATSVTDLWVHLSPSAMSVTDLWRHLSPSATFVTDLWSHLSPSATSVTERERREREAEGGGEREWCEFLKSCTTSEAYFPTPLLLPPLRELASFFPSDRQTERTRTGREDQDRQGGPGQTGRTRTDREDQDREAPAVSHSGAGGRKGHGQWLGVDH